MRPGGWVLNVRPDQRCCEVRVSRELWAWQFAEQLFVSQACGVLAAIPLLDVALAVIFEV